MLLRRHYELLFVLLLLMVVLVVQILYLCFEGSEEILNVCLLLWVTHKSFLLVFGNYKV